MSSLCLHLLIAVFVWFSQASPLSQPGNPFEWDDDSFIRFLGDLRLNAEKDGISGRKLPDLSDEELDQALRMEKIPDLRLGEKERAEFFKKLVRAYILLKERAQQSNPNAKVTLSDVLAYLKELGELELSSGSKVYPDRGSLGKQSLKFRGISKAKRDKIKQLRSFEEFEKDHTEIQRNQVKVETETGIKYIPIEYYFRDSPYEEILAMGVDLFYAIRGFPILEVGTPREVSTSKKEGIDDFFGQERGFVVVYMEQGPPNPGFIRGALDPERKSLQIDDDEERLLLDSLMGLREEDQLEYFRKNYLEKYDWDSGDLSGLTKRFIRENISNVIIVIDDISGAFDFIEELYFNKPSDFFFYEEWLKNPETATSEQFLLYLAGHYDFEKRALVYLMNAYEKAKKIINQKYFKINVFNKRLKSYIIKEFHEELAFELKRRGYDTFEEVFDLYRDEQMKIYDLLIQAGGDAKSRGLYMKGCLHWDEGQHELALATWDKISPMFKSKTVRDIRDIQVKYRDRSKIVPLINEVFEWESSTNSKKLLERLLKYNRWKLRSIKTPTV